MHVLLLNLLLLELFIFRKIIININTSTTAGIIFTGVHTVIVPPALVFCNTLTSTSLTFKRPFKSCGFVVVSIFYYTVHVYNGYRTFHAF